MLTIRLAGPEDVEDVYLLSNDPVVRAVSLSTDAIPYENHVKWYTARLADTATLFLLVHDAQNLVSQVRFFRESVDCAEISISIASAYRGRGLGSEIMHMAIRFVRDFWQIRRILAMVKTDNAASNSFFLKCGYVLDAETNYKSCACYRYYYYL